ncbi:hypothetical protein [Prescottella agglutinans]|uniref:DUF3828 domain-containing protein n=1 Tax=Prescottella agglutinans TaxID=1644129 RepID=A0ABT6MJN1_9NOCA|nr:hypothetical protein [Prescottella agglutinans]MDH6284522.1 hypothetical protein [Prescottella agglutinans]
MKASKLIMAAIIIATVGFLAWVYFAADRVEDKSTAAEQSTTCATTTTAAGAPPADVETTEPPAPSRAAEEAARQGLTVAFTWYPATDATQNDAYGRARNWLTDKLADRMIIDATTERGPSVQWAQWAQDQAKVIADVNIGCSGCPEDTDTVVQRVATIKQTAIAGSRTDTVKPDTTVWVTVVRQGDRWLIDDIRY